jgi:hypothetical protein
MSLRNEKTWHGRVLPFNTASWQIARLILGFYFAKSLARLKRTERNSPRPETNRSLRSERTRFETFSSISCRPT